VEKQRVQGLFLKRKPDLMPGTEEHIYDNTCKSVEDTVREIELAKYRMIFKQSETERGLCPQSCDTFN